MQIASLAKSMVLEIAAAESIAMSRPCMNGGVIEFDLTDYDGDAAPSPGDILRVTLRDCETVYLNAVASGDLLITLTTPSPSPMPEETAISGSIDASALTISVATGIPITASMGGTPSFSYREDPLQTTLTVSGDATFSVNDAGTTVTETLSEFEFRKHQSFEEARYQIEVSGLFDSEELGGSFEFGDMSYLSGYLATYPEQGRLELIGRDDSRVAMAANDADGLGNGNVNIWLDTEGDGFFDPLSRTSWDELSEEFLWWFEDPDDLWYSTRHYSSTTFAIARYEPRYGDIVRHDTGMRIQYERRVDPTSVPDELYACVSGVEMQYDHFCVPLDIDLRGALLLLTPTEQLPQNYRVRYPYPNFDAVDERGNSTNSLHEFFHTNETVFASAYVSNTSVISGDTVTLDASGSSATEGSITSYQWSQVSGPAISINDANSASATFVVPAVKDEGEIIVNRAEEIVLSLEVTSSEGLRDFEIIKMAAFARESDIRLWSFTGDGGDWISQGKNWLLTSESGSLRSQRNTERGVTFTHELYPPERQLWTLQLSAVDDAKLTVGVYEDARNYPVPGGSSNTMGLFGDGRGCSILTGRFEVLEISYNAIDNVIAAAIDFEQYCDGNSSLSNSRAYGSVRVASSVPVPVGTPPAE